MATQTIKSFIDQILDDLGEPISGSGFWDRPDVRETISLVQREITLETENLLVITPTIEPSANDTEITIDEDGNLLRIVDGYRLETTEGPIAVYTREQIEKYDYQWKTRTGSLVLALMTDIADEGRAMIYPKIDNANNDIVVWFIKLAKEITTDEVIKASGDASSQLTLWSLTGVTLRNTNVFRLYWDLSDTAGTRTVSLYKASGKASGDLVAQGTLSGDGSITLSAQNSSGLSGSVTVAYSTDDTDSANTLDLAYIEIPSIDIPCLKAGVKAILYDMESDGKDKAKTQLYRTMYGFDYTGGGNHMGLLKAIKNRLRKKRQGTHHVFHRRRDIGDGGDLIRVVINDTAIVP